MRSCAGGLFVVAAILAAAAPAIAQDRKSELQDLVFGLCPKVLDGSVSLSDQAQLATLGFVATAPRETSAGKLPRAERGVGANKVVLSSGEGSCSIWFGGPDNPQTAGGVVEQAWKAQYNGSGKPMTLGDGTMLFLFNSKGEPKRSVTILLGDAGGELGFRPATTVVMMNDKGK